MDFVESRHYRLNKYLLSSVCLWPGQTSGYTRYFRVIMDVLLVHFIIVQLTIFFTRAFSMELLLRILPLATVDALFVLRYNSFLYYERNIKELIEKMQYEWSTVKCNEERQILDSYANGARFLTICLAYLLYSSLLLFLTSGCVTDVLDIFVPLNETRTRQLPHMVEYFVDQEKYFYSILLLMSICIFIGVTTLLSTESISLLFVTRVSGLFRVTCYRVESICDVPVSSCSIHERGRITFRRIINAVVIYQKAIAFANLYVDTFMTTYFLLLIFGVAASTVYLFRLSQAIAVGDSMDQIGMSVLLIIVLFSYMFVCNYVSQTVIDNHADIFTKLCNLEWYTAPLQAQKLLLLFIQRTTKNYMLTPGGIFIASLKGFSGLVNTSFSYFMVIYSKQ